MPPKKLNKKKQIKKTGKKQIPKKNIPKRTQQQKPKDTQTHTQNVYINTHRQQRVQSSVPRRSHNTISTPIIVPFVQQLPPGHPFNNNAPQNQSGTSPNVPVNPSVPQTNNSLSTQVGAAPPQTPSAAPQTPSAPLQKQKRGKNPKFSNQEGGKNFPKLTDLNDDLNGLGAKTLNAILDREFEDSDKLFNKKTDRRNKKRVESAAKKARDQQMREMLQDYS